MFCGPGGSKSGLAKVAGAKPFGRMRDKQLHDAVARSIFRSQHVKNTSASEPFWKLRCRKSACRCGAKDAWSKHNVLGGLLEVDMLQKCTACAKHTVLGALLEDEMLTQCAPLWREAHFQVRVIMLKAPQRRSPFGSWDVEKVHAVVAPRCVKQAQRSWRTFGSWHVARVHGVCKAHRSRGSFGRWDVDTVRAIVAWSTFPSQSHNVESTSASEPFWKLRCRKCARNYNYSCSSNCNCARTT